MVIPPPEKSMSAGNVEAVTCDPVTLYVLAGPSAESSMARVLVPPVDLAKTSPRMLVSTPASPTLVVLPDTLPVSVVVVTPLGVACTSMVSAPAPELTLIVDRPAAAVVRSTVVVAPLLLTLAVTEVLLPKFISSKELVPPSLI